MISKLKSISRLKIFQKLDPGHYTKHVHLVDCIVVRHYGIYTAGIPGSPAAFYHFMKDAAGKPCNHSPVQSELGVKKELTNRLQETNLPVSCLHYVPMKNNTK